MRRIRALVGTPPRRFTRRRLGRAYRPRVARIPPRSAWGIRSAFRYRAFRYGMRGAAVIGGLHTAGAVFRKSKRLVGNRIGRASTKKIVQYQQAYVTKNGKTLYVNPLDNLAYGTDTNQRERNIVNVRGFHICMGIKSEVNHPIYLNIAVISPKDISISTSADVGVNFFRNYAANDRGLDFGNAQTALQMHCSPINPEVHNILWHTKTRIAGKADSSGGGGGDFSSALTSYKNYEKWVPLSRQLSYDAVGSATPKNGRVFLVYWMNKVGDSDAGGMATAGVLANVETNVITYFRDPK